ncbi:MAG: aromatic amino acid lyase, partial [Cyanobacteria bacterium REEB65]|nr:aromatic amino acid lyase [Cyanobacteria bacterium REEB65]
MAPVTIRGDGLTVADVVSVARRGAAVELDPTCHGAIGRSRAFIEQIVDEGRVVYGVTTGFGALKDRRIPKAETEALQHNLIRSHSAGVGSPFPAAVVRAILLLRANALAKGASGVRLQTIERLVDLLNLGLHPVIPCQGSVGASGDLAPLAHMALALIGEGQIERDGQILPARAALAQAGLEPLRLGAKEGLALINGTQAMTALGCLVLAQAEALAKLADIACAATLDAVMGSNRA